MESSHANKDSHPARSTRHTFAGFLIDLDGTIIDSTEAVVKHWHKLGDELGVDHQVIIQSSRGQRSIDTLRLYDPSKANWEYVNYVEGLIPQEYGAYAGEIPGARQFLNSLDQASAPWAIVTSCTRTLMCGWLDRMSLSRPPVSVAAEDVSAGKPDPACYRLGRERIGLAKEQEVLVFEDAPAGVRAGKAAGCMVLGLATTHDRARLKDAGADWVVQDLTSVELVGKRDDGWEISMEEKI